MGDNVTVSAKQLDPGAVPPTPVETPAVQEHQSPRAHPVVLSVAMQAQAITPWGMAQRFRDRELRAFWISEPWLASVVYSVSIRNASFAWEVVGSDPSATSPKNTIRAVQRVLNSSNRGRGWKNLITKTCVDLYTQDNGAFWYLARRLNRPDQPVMNIVSLDAGQCQRTGDLEYPVIYTNRRGVERILNWWEVQTLEEFPSPIESALDMQLCAVSRCMLAAEIIQSLAVYKQEKISGTFSKAIDIVNNVTAQNIEDALEIDYEQRLNKGLLRYSIPIILPGVDPTATLSHIHIDLASLPDNFDEDASLKWYVAQLAAAFGVDYQEIAPLMTGNLGSSQQSEIMHLKTRGKGPALIMGIIEDILNGGGILPGNVRFRFLEQDIRSESEKATARFTRAKERSLRIESGELDAVAARRLAVTDGDLPEWMASEIDAREQERMNSSDASEESGLQQDEGEEDGAELSANQIMGGIETQNQMV